MTPQPSRRAAVTRTSSYGYGDTSGKVAVGDSRVEEATAWSSLYSPWGLPKGTHTSLQGCGAATTEGGELMTQLKGPRLDRVLNMANWAPGRLGKLNTQILDLHE